jgi:hypothetical protein
VFARWPIDLSSVTDPRPIGATAQDLFADGIDHPIGSTAITGLGRIFAFGGERKIGDQRQMVRSPAGDRGVADEGRFEPDAAAVINPVQPP